MEPGHRGGGGAPRLFGNPRGEFGLDPPWPIEHPVAHSVIWIIGIVVVCAPLAIWAYRRTITE